MLIFRTTLTLVLTSMIWKTTSAFQSFASTRTSLPFLAEVLGIPEVVEFYQRSICSGLEALCIFLKRHSYPCQYSDMIACFGKPVPVLSIIKNYMIDYIYQAPSHRILQWNDSILQSKLKENILGKCLSTGATKFFKIVLADKKAKTDTEVVVLSALLNLVRISSLSNCLTLEWFSAVNFLLVSV